MFFSLISAAEVAVMLKYLDKIKEAAIQLKKLLLDVNFGLQESYCHNADLKAL